MFKLNPTRGFGLLEGFLASQRSKIANQLIPVSFRKGKILDIGCGTFPVFLLKTEFNEKYGMDSSLKIAQYDDKNIYSIPSDVGKENPLPFKDDFFDVVVLLAVLEHIKIDEVKFILKEIRRVLKKGGRFILTTPSPWAKGLLELMSKLYLISQDEINDHKGSNNYYEVVNFLKQTGFDQTRIKQGQFEFFLNNWAYADK